METLEDVIDELEKLDHHRRRAAELRGKGQIALVDLVEEARKRSAGNELKNSILQSAAAVKALLVHHRGRLRQHGKKDAARIGALQKQLVDVLEDANYKEVFRIDLDNLPVLRAARGMSALVAAPDSAFSKSVFLFYYVIVREMMTADAPDWVVGGARAGDVSAPSAFVTAECTRAVAGFRKALAATGDYIEMIASMLARRYRLTEGGVPGEWLRVDRERAALEFQTTAELLKRNIALKLDSLEAIENLDDFLDASRDDIRNAIGTCLRAFRAAKKEIERFRRGEQNELTDKRFVRSETAHRIALGAVEWAVDQADQAHKVFRKVYTKKELKRVPREVLELREVASLFHEAAKETAKILNPAKEFVSRVLDRQLALASAGFPWDAAEMAFAAVSYGYVSGSWDDDRLRHAVKHLIDVMSPRGRFPIGKPIYTSSEGMTLHVINAEVLRSFAQLLEHVRDVAVSPDVARRMLVFLEDTQFSDKPGLWHNEEARMADAPRYWVTASAIYALDRINRMLDARINERVFGFFSVRKPVQLSIPSLPGLFYPDYGLAWRDPKHDSVAVIMERMRAHVCGVADEGTKGRTWSLILYGPPGTGKTTLAESLAKSCNVPIVDVTPSDIVVAGVEKIEHRTRAVFKALSLLTRAVIMFDEFEPVLQQRKRNDPDRSVLRFVTPGMLPKLKTLHDMAERRSVAYVLNTNLPGDLDNAATRTGRFDTRAGIFPPDVLSRIGRLRGETDEFQRKNPEVTVNEKRVWKVVQNTAAGPMNTLGKPGWFTRPKRVGTDQENIFEYIFGGAEVRLPEVEAVLKDAGRAAGEGEFYEWSVISAWDRKIRKKAWSIDPPTNEEVSSFIDETWPPAAASAPRS